MVKHDHDSDTASQGETEDWKAKFLKSQEEIERLKAEIMQLKGDIESLKVELVNHSERDRDNDSSDDEDDESVCDGSPWSTKYFALKQYRQANRDCMVPRSHKGLGEWVNNQRKAYKKKKLDPDRIHKLNKLGMYWGKDFPPPKTWSDYFQEWKTHIDTFGISASVHEDSDLGKWVADQRKQGKRLRKAKPSTLITEQYKQLNELSFKWSSRKRRRT
jgi:hypothetical protein